METDSIVRFLREYPDDQLMALQDAIDRGILSYMSCSCLIGLRTAPHPPIGIGNYCDECLIHIRRARILPFAEEAEHEFCKLGYDGIRPPSDALRRERLKPLVLAEISRRGMASIEVLAAVEAV